jgi:hypothetical protein
MVLFPLSTQHQTAATTINCPEYNVPLNKTITLQRDRNYIPDFQFLRKEPKNMHGNYDGKFIVPS